MYIIGEKINGMFKKVNQAIKEKNSNFIKELVQQQLEAGADALDVNVGPESTNPLEDMKWLISTIKEVTNVPLAIDTTKPEIMEEGLKLAGEGSFINSTYADDEKLEIYIPLAKKYNAKLIALTISQTGVPQDTSGKMELVSNIIQKCLECEYNIENLYIDPVILPINVSQQNAIAVLEVIQQIKLISNPPPKTLLGLSNISQGTKYRSLIDRTYVTLALAFGLDSAILNPLDSELMNSIITAELLLGKQLYCESFLDAYRKKIELKN
ncbi:MAG: dihydropteroate synthase [Elusimicrobiota bacterium]|nr:dihydropteroate synthase [Endomicrobiia bacterium]MDW8165660.1 dihydropteroate synthase [Elusimicrobiota bacterium]